MKKRGKSAKYFSIEKKKTALELSEQEWQLLNSIRSNLIPGRAGIVAGVMRRRQDQLWQGWICVGKGLIYISARSSREHASAHVGAFLTATDRPGFSGGGGKMLLRKIKSEGGGPPPDVFKKFNKETAFY